MIWNSAGRDSERNMPFEWQRLYAIRRAWDRQAGRLTVAEHKTIWLEMLAQAKTSGAKVTVLDELTHHWTPTAEPELLKLLTDANQELPVRLATGRCLALAAGKSGHEQLVALLEGARSFAERNQWFDIVADPRYKQEAGEDPRVVRLGFALFAEERKRSPDDYLDGGAGAYFITIKLGNYVGAKNQFQPDLTAAHRGGNGPSEAFFADTVRSAAQWWALNRHRYDRPPVPELHPSLSAPNFAAALIGHWETAFAAPGRTNVTRAEFRRDGTATVVVVNGKRETKHTGPYRLEFERPPATNMVTLAKITIQHDGGELILSHVNFDMHNGVQYGRVLLRIDGQPVGALDRVPVSNSGRPRRSKDQ
jgi:hypothetical protein